MRGRVLAMGVAMIGGAAQAAEPQRVTIPALHADGVTLTGYFQPPTNAGPGRAPAVVLMHGCSGPVTASGRIRSRERDWMERFAQAGYASLLVDSFNPRGVRSTCGRPTKGLSAEEDRPFDAYAALRWLKSRGEIDGGRVAVMGWSHGGTTVLSAASPPMAGKLGAQAGRFAIAVAFYPGCRALARTDYRVGLPLLMHLGQADDWTPATYCEALARKAVETGGNVEMYVYPGAFHGFDSPAGEVRERRLPSGRVVHNGADPAARTLAIGRTMAALAKALGERGR